VRVKKQILHFGWVLLSLAVAAQGSKKDLTEYYHTRNQLCGGMDSILNRKGTWKHAEDAIIFPDRTFPSNQYNQLNSRMDKVLPLFKEALPDLSGFEPRWYHVIDGTSYIPNGPMPYEFSSLYLIYYCNDNMKKILLGDETGTWIYVYINELGWFCDKVDDWDINNDGKMIRVYSLPPTVGKWKETALYAPFSHDSAHAVIVGHDGKLPWHTLTQKQYLTGLKNKWRDESQKKSGAYDESEEKMKKEIDKVSKSNSPQAPKTKEILEQQLKDLQSKKEGFKSSTRKYYDEEIKYIDEYLANASAETLEQVAYIDPKYHALKFRGTFGDENNGTRLIAIGAKYFNSDLPRYVPQFMILYWRWTQDPVSIRFKKQFEENFPLEKLRAMIDK
jgi:hypothetical protein